MIFEEMGFLSRSMHNPKVGGWAGIPGEVKVSSWTQASGYDCDHPRLLYNSPAKHILWRHS